MKKYSVFYSILTTSTTTIEAENEQEAKEKFNQGNYDHFEENDECVDVQLTSIEEM